MPRTPKIREAVIKEMEPLLPMNGKKLYDGSGTPSYDDMLLSRFLKMTGLKIFKPESHWRKSGKKCVKRLQEENCNGLGDSRLCE